MIATKEELEAAARKDVNYEIAKAQAALTLLAGSTPGTDEAHFYLEGFILHFRNLFHFLYDTPSQDDIVAGHYIQGWEQSRPPAPPGLEEAKKRAHKMLAHLTFSRLHLPPNWDIQGIWSDLLSVLTVFFVGLSEEQKNWFPKLREISGSMGS